jgi:hypothetical protein
MKYLIKISYGTGDSFSNRDEVGYIDMEWSNLEVAVENIKRIEEHYKMYRAINDSWGDKRPMDEVIEEAIIKDWAVVKYRKYAKKGKIEQIIDDSEVKRWENLGFNIIEKPERMTLEHSIKLKTDDGKDFQTSCFWCGYFEILYDAEIEQELPKVSFR